jgi:hypothetical protein
LAEIDLEIGLIQFISCFKTSVIGDPRIIMLGQTALEESIGKRVEQEED